MLSGLLRSQTLFEEFKIGRKTISLNSKTTIQRIYSLIAGKQSSMATPHCFRFDEYSKILTPIYETDMTDNVVNKQTALRENIDNYNEAVRIATNTDDKVGKIKKELDLSPTDHAVRKQPLCIHVSWIEPDPEDYRRI